MFRKYLTLTLIGLVLNLTFYSTAMANTEKDTKFADKVKVNIVNLGTGKDAKIEIKLKDGAILKGFVSEVKDSGFVLTSEETGLSKEISYLQVKQVKGGNSKTGQRIFAIVAVVVLLTVLSWGAARGN